MTREEVLDLLRESVESFNQVHGEKQLVFTPETPLFGIQSALDSLDLVLFIVEVEARLADRYGLENPLSDDRAMSAHRSPFRTIATLAEYILTLGPSAHG